MIAYLDLPSGLSGDMFLGCLLDAGWPLTELQGIVTRLKLPEPCTVESTTAIRGPLRGTLATVKTPHSHHHRHLHHIRQIIDQSDLPAAVKERSIAVFVRLANAEAKVHGTTPEKIHFHEVGALDAIIDIVCSVAGVAALGIDRLHASALPLGEGWAKTDHGQIPLPAPATLELLSTVSAPTRPAPGPGELLTPTGAALLAELATFSQPPMRLMHIAIGIGQKELPWPNIARLWLGEPSDSGPLIQIETNIDDMNPQFHGPVMQHLLAAGAVDVWLTPVQMKKNRPAVVLSVLAPAAREAALADIILRETTTLGLRVHSVHRHEARREMRTVQTPYGPVRLKLKWLGEDLAGAMPEYEDCLKLAEEKGQNVRAVYEAAQAAGHALGNK